ncbi:MAG: hypothetical protein V3V08_08375 [Nannocystaceae bacterium]
MVVLLRSADILPVGTQLTLTPINPDREFLAVLEAEVVRVEGEAVPGRTLKIGARFKALGAEERRCLLWLMNHAPKTTDKSHQYFAADNGPGTSHYRMRVHILRARPDLVSTGLAA